jgi:dienelactone hydrolase
MRRYSGLIAGCDEPPPNAVVASPALATKHPLLLYFPGWAATAVDNLTLIERLARSGFIVAAIHYPARVMGLSSAVAKRQRAVVEKPMDFSSAQAFADTIELAEYRVRARATDAGAVLDAIASARLADVDRRLLARIDLDRVGIFGFSLGGAVAAEASLRDHRFRAAVNLDGWHFGEALERGVPRPYLFISDDTPLPTACDLISPRPSRRYGAMLNCKNHEQLTTNLARHGGHLLTIAGTRHEDFAGARSQTNFWRRLRRGRIAPERVSEIVFKYARSFFAEHLQDEKSPALNGAAAYPEVRLQSWPRTRRD